MILCMDYLCVLTVMQRDISLGWGGGGGGGGGARNRVCNFTLLLVAEILHIYLILE